MAHSYESLYLTVIQQCNCYHERWYQSKTKMGGTKDHRRDTVGHTNFEINEFKPLIYNFLAICDYLSKWTYKLQILSSQYIDLNNAGKNTPIIAYCHFWLQYICNLHNNNQLKTPKCLQENNTKKQKSISVFFISVWGFIFFCLFVFWTFYLF